MNRIGFNRPSNWMAILLSLALMIGGMMLLTSCSNTATTTTTQTQDPYFDCVDSTFYVSRIKVVPDTVGPVWEVIADDESVFYGFAKDLKGIVPGNEYTFKVTLVEKVLWIKGVNIK